MSAESDLRLWYPHCDADNLYRYRNAGQDFERLRVSRKKRKKQPPATGEFPTVKTDERPPFEFYSWAWGWRNPLTRKRYHSGDWVSHGGFFHPLIARDPEKRRRLRSILVREGGSIELRASLSPTETEAVYASVLHVRRWLLLLPLLIATLLVCLCLSFCGNPAAQDGRLSFLQGMTRPRALKANPCFLLNTRHIRAPQIARCKPIGLRSTSRYRCPQTARTAPTRLIPRPLSTSTSTTMGSSKRPNSSTTRMAICSRLVQGF